MSKKVQTFDPFSNIAKDIIEFEIKHPVTGDGTGMFIKMYSKCSDEYRAMDIREAERKKELYKISRKGKFSVKEIDPAEEFIKDREAIASLIIGWSGTETPYSPEKAKELMTSQKMYLIALQVLEAFEDDANLY